MKKAKFKIKFPTYASYLAVLFLGAFIFGILINSDGSGSGEFFHYSGPVLPMTSLNGAEGVEAERNVNFDFSPYQTPNAYHHVAKGAAGITDTYVLTNTTGEAKTLELVYGFQGSFADFSEEFPTITIDGTPIQPELYPSMDPEEKLHYSGSFEKYREILEENDFLTTATKPYEEPDIPVTAYHFTDLAYNGSVMVANPMLTLRCSLDENTFVWAHGLTKSETEKDGREVLLFAVKNGEAWLFAMGGPIIDPEYGGNKGFNIEKDSAIDGVTFQLETYETTLIDAIQLCAEKYLQDDEDSDDSPITPELLAECTARSILSTWDLETKGIGGFDYLFYEEIHDSRMMYQVFPVTLEAGQSVKVEAAYIQKPSYDTGGPKQWREGYDLATKLGSDLNFTALTSSLSNTDFIVLGKQNFGFDLDQGITAVTLDLQVERYYMEVSPAK